MVVVEADGISFDDGVDDVRSLALSEEPENMRVESHGRKFVVHSEADAVADLDLSRQVEVDPVDVGAEAKSGQP